MKFSLYLALSEWIGCHYIRNTDIILFKTKHIIKTDFKEVGCGFDSFESG